jgi:hypothetical protein
MVHRGGLAVVAFVLVVVACADDTSGTVFTTTTADGGTSAATTTIVGDTTTTADTTTTVAETTTTTIAFFIDLDSLDPIPPSEAATGVDALLGGAPDDSVSRALIAAIEEEAIDLTGVTITVWPVSGTGESLLIVEFDETAGVFAEDDTIGSLMISTLVSHPLIDDQAITRLVMKIAGTDEQGPYVFTFTASIEAIRASIVSGASIPEGEALFQLERGEP